MHELSIAMNVIAIAEREGAAAGGRIAAVHVQVGALSGVVREALAFSWEVASADSSVAGARLLIEEVPVSVYCDACVTEQTLPAAQPLICPQCGAATPDIRRGRELQVVSLEIA
jgi:hydrogenase nickel incorporation protein HypA/HybF